MSIRFSHDNNTFTQVAGMDQAPRDVRQLEFESNLDVFYGPQFQQLYNINVKRVKIVFVDSNEFYGVWDLNKQILMGVDTFVFNCGGALFQNYGSICYTVNVVLMVQVDSNVIQFINNGEGIVQNVFVGPNITEDLISLIDKTKNIVKIQGSFEEHDNQIFINGTDQGSIKMAKTIGLPLLDQELVKQLAIEEQLQNQPKPTVEELQTTNKELQTQVEQLTLQLDVSREETAFVKELLTVLTQKIKKITAEAAEKDVLISTVKEDLAEANNKLQELQKSERK